MIPQPEIGQPYNPRGYFHFLMVPDPVAGYKKLKQLDKLAYGKLAEYLGHKMNCFPGQRRLAEDLGVSATLINASLKRLEKEGLIRKIAPEGIDRLKHKTCRYELLWHPILQEELARTPRIAPSITPAFGESEPRRLAKQNPIVIDPEERDSEERDSGTKSQLSPGQIQIKIAHRKMRERRAMTVLENHKEAMATKKKSYDWRLTPKLKKLICARFDSGYSVDDLKKAAINLSKDPWHRGVSKGKKEWIHPTLLYRDDDHVDEWLNAKEGKGIKRSYIPATETRNHPLPEVMDMNDDKAVARLMKRMGGRR